MAGKPRIDVDEPHNDRIDPSAAVAGDAAETDS
jgi:hypothetical protein